jgi:uncharacterized protein YfkK (UPF0435 family)
MYNSSFPSSSLQIASSAERLNVMDVHVITFFDIDQRRTDDLTVFDDMISFLKRK